MVMDSVALEPPSCFVWSCDEGEDGVGVGVVHARAKLNISLGHGNDTCLLGVEVHVGDDVGVV